VQCKTDQISILFHTKGKVGFRSSSVVVLASDAGPVVCHCLSDFPVFMLNSNSGDFLRRKLEICQNLANFFNNFTALTGAFLFFCKMVKICQKQTLIVSS
jgi:hypothetical protein